jgi:hypothetical protein
MTQQQQQQQQMQHLSMVAESKQLVSIQRKELGSNTFAARNIHQ